MWLRHHQTEAGETERNNQYWSACMGESEGSKKVGCLIRQSCPLQVPSHVHRNIRSITLPYPAASLLTSAVVLVTPLSSNEVSLFTAHHGPQLLPPRFHLLTSNIPLCSSLCYPPAGASPTSAVALATPPSSSEASPSTGPSWCTAGQPWAGRPPPWGWASSRCTERTRNLPCELARTCT